MLKYVKHQQLKIFKVGENDIINTGSVVTKNVPSNCIINGNPAKIIKRNKE